jgi:hypothetical protein
MGQAHRKISGVHLLSFFYQHGVKNVTIQTQFPHPFMYRVLFKTHFLKFGRKKERLRFVCERDANMRLSCAVPSTFPGRRYPANEPGTAYQTIYLPPVRSCHLAAESSAAHVESHPLALFDPVSPFLDWFGFCMPRDGSGSSNGGAAAGGGGGGGGEWLRPMDAEQLRECGHRMVDFVADYYKSIETFPVLSQVQARTPPPVLHSEYLNRHLNEPCSSCFKIQ